MMLLLSALINSATTLAPNCKQEHQQALIFSATSLPQLNELQTKLPRTFVLRFTYAERRFVLQPEPVSAQAFLDLLPQSEAQEGSLYNNSAHDCASSAEEDQARDAAYDEAEQLAARALMFSPGRMDQYVHFGLFATEDVHSQYGSLSVPICRTFKMRFRQAVDRLTPENRLWFTKHIVDPDGCTNQMPEE